MEYDSVLISAENVEDARAILTPLIEQKLAVGGVMAPGLAMWRWKGKTVEMPYVFINAFAPTGNRKAIKRVVRKYTKEEVPVTAFTRIDDGGDELMRWIDQSTEVA